MQSTWTAITGSQAVASSVISITGMGSPNKYGLILVFPVITAGGRGLGVVAPSIAAPPSITGARGYSTITTAVLHSQASPNIDHNNNSDSELYLTSYSRPITLANSSRISQH